VSEGFTEIPYLTICYCLPHKLRHSFTFFFDLRVVSNTTSSDKFHPRWSNGKNAADQKGVNSQLSIDKRNEIGVGGPMFPCLSTVNLQ